MKTLTIGLIVGLFAVTSVMANNPSEMFSQMQMLRSEIFELRSQSEMQELEIKQLKAAQMDLHQEIYQLKEQLQNISTINSNSSTSVPVNNEANQISNVLPNSPKDQITQADPAEEKKYYDVAFDLIRKRDFAKAKLAFQGFIKRFPNGKYISHANYWLGEVHLAQGELIDALNIFSIFTTAYPNSPKLPDALFKLADTQRRLGQFEQARGTLNQLIQKFPNSSAAQLAKAELAR